ncbi:MAG: hypothetical protein ACI965_001811, partial [Paraglaciecola sp.]
RLICIRLKIPEQKTFGILGADTHLIMDMIQLRVRKNSGR